MAIFQKRYIKKYIDLTLLSIQYQRPQKGIYYLTISRRAQKIKSNQFYLNQKEVTSIEQTFHFICHFLASKDGTWNSKFLRLKLIQKQKSINKVLAIWKYDLKKFQHQHFSSLQLSPKFNSRYLGDISLSLLLSDNSRNPIVANSNLNGIINKTRIYDSADTDFQNDITFLHSSFLQHQTISSQAYSSFDFSDFSLSQFHSSFDSFECNPQEKHLDKNILSRNSNCISILNKSKQKITSILEKFINDDIEHIISFPVISKKLLAKIAEDMNNFEPIFFVFRWSDIMSSLKQKEISRKIYVLVATIHLISTLRQNQLLSKDDPKIIVDSFKKLYDEVLNSILENAKSHLGNEDNVNAFCLNLLDQLNQIGHGKFCNIVYSSLLLGLVFSVSDEFTTTCVIIYVFLKSKKIE
jgi:hypothetical protein